MATGEQFLQSKDGTEIYVKQFNTTSPKAQLLVIHGYLDHCQRYDEFAEYLNGKGISVTLFDYRGHGKSGGGRALLSAWKDYEDDLEAAWSTLLPSDKLPTFVLGHSNGGLLLLNYLFQGKADDKGLKGVVFSSPYIKPAENLPIYKIWAAKIFGTLFPSLKVPADLKSSDLTLDPKKQKEHDEDPLLQKMASTGWALQTMNTQAKVQDLIDTTKVSMPVLWAFGGKDLVADPQVNEEMGAKLQAEDKTVVNRTGEMHEILNEVKRQELFDIMGDWILKRS